MVIPFSMRPLHLLAVYRVTSLTRKRTALGPYRKPMPRVLSRGVLAGGVGILRGTPVQRGLMPPSPSRNRAETVLQAPKKNL